MMKLKEKKKKGKENIKKKNTIREYVGNQEKLETKE